MIPIIVIAAAAFVVLGLAVTGIVLYRRAKRFRPTENKQLQQDELNALLDDAGFGYNRECDCFYSLHDCWQREVGYCKLYDDGAPGFNMIIDAEPIEFSYGGKRWLIELWKGQYGITTGSEIGVYNTSYDDISLPDFTGTFYEAVPDSEMLKFSFTLRKKNRILLERSDVHWWLTGFCLGEFSKPKSLTMDAVIEFPDPEMAQAFVSAMQRVGYKPKEYTFSHTTVSVHYRKPHSRKPGLIGKIRNYFIQKVNKSNCKLYRQFTAPYPDTLDGLEYCRAIAPELFDFLLNSLYAHSFFSAFEWIRDLIGKRPPTPKPVPRPPFPPRPCPPVKPCAPCPPPCTPSHIPPVPCGNCAPCQAGDDDHYPQCDCGCRLDSHESCDTKHG